MLVVKLVVLLVGRWVDSMDVVLVDLMVVLCHSVIRKREKELVFQLEGTNERKKANKQERKDCCYQKAASWAGVMVVKLAVLLVD